MRAIRYTIKQAFSQILRNLNMSTASIFAITAMMLILGLFFTIMVNVNLLSQNVQDQFDTIQVYLPDGSTEAQSTTLMKQTKQIEHVVNAQYISKEDALEIMKERWGENAYLLDGLPDNPFPVTIEVTIEDIQYEGEIVEQLKAMEGIEEVKYSQETIDKLLKITGYIQKGALALIIILIAVSIIVVANTIKLTVHARQNEISIMKYVGATNWFIRGPFLVEGMIIGFIASILGAAIVGVAYYKFVEYFASKTVLLFSTGLVPFNFIINNLVIIFVALGICIGSIGSILSMRRFLDA